MKISRLLSLVIIFFALFCSTLVLAEGEEQKNVTKVEVQGNKNISGATIISKVRTREGKPFSQVVASDDLKRLYSLGYFSDIKIDLRKSIDGVEVIFQVEELPIILGVVVKGNKSLKTDKLEKLIKSKAGDFFNVQQLKQDMRDIQKLYEEKGYPLASIDYELDVTEDTNEATVEIVVSEKERIKIKNIFIEGNTAFSNKKIRKLMSTKKDGWFNSGVYKKEVLEMDLMRINSFYNENGYLDVQVASEISYGPEEKHMFVTIAIDEGKQYYVGDVQIRGAKIFPEGEVRERLSMHAGDVFDRDMLRIDLANIQSYYFERGHISAEAGVNTALNEASGNIDIVYTVDEDELAYINKIKIRGNTKTKDIVIRRELRSYPGEAFDGGRLNKSKERLYNLGFFQEFSYDTEDTKIANKKDLIVNVKEAKTGEFAFGAGFSSTEKFVGFVEIAQRNFDITNFGTFTGAGQDLRVKMEIGSTRREFDISFTEPWIFGYPLSFGVDGYNRTRERSGTTGYSYDETRAGGDLRLGKEFTDNLRASAMYKIESVDISNVPDNASQALLDEEGETTISSMTLGLTYDVRDSIFSPSRGYVLTSSGEVAGGPFGMDEDFYKLIGTGTYYKTLLEKLLLQLKFVMGGSGTYSDSTVMPVYERFYAGGTNTIRGYEERTVGPKDRSGEPVGGESLLYGGAEFIYPLFDVIKIATFYDVGNVWEKLGDLGSGDFKYSVGLGVRVKTPMGPVKLDYGYPLVVDAGEDQEGRFHFSMSRGF